VRLRTDGRALVELKTVWRDGTSHLPYEPIEFMEQLAAIIPRPTTVRSPRMLAGAHWSLATAARHPI
jgi:hypothetical protein